MHIQKTSKGLRVGSMCRYAGAQRHLSKFFGEKPADGLTASAPAAFVEHMLQNCSDRTTKDYLILIRACWDWGKEQQLLEFERNPWFDVLEQLKVAPRQRVKPFTAEEVQSIEAAFRSNRYYSHYADFVSFLFGTGCRFGEAAGLMWKHIGEDCKSVWIGESVSRGVRTATKTNRARTIKLTPKVIEILKSRRQRHHCPEDLVFPAPKGGEINDHTFRRREWKTVLEQIGIDYRKPYATRHTAISHALAGGANYLQVADATGHDPQILHEHYASAQ